MKQKMKGLVALRLALFFVLLLAKVVLGHFIIVSGFT